MLTVFANKSVIISYDSLFLKMPNLLEITVEKAAIEWLVEFKKSVLKEC